MQNIISFQDFENIKVVFVDVIILLEHRRNFSIFFFLKKLKNCTFGHKTHRKFTLFFHINCIRFSYYFCEIGCKNACSFLGLTTLITHHILHNDIELWLWKSVLSINVVIVMHYMFVLKGIRFFFYKIDQNSQKVFFLALWFIW